MIIQHTEINENVDFFFLSFDIISVQLNGVLKGMIWIRSFVRIVFVFCSLFSQVGQGILIKKQRLIFLHGIWRILCPLDGLIGLSMYTGFYISFSVIQILIFFYRLYGVIKKKKGDLNIHP